MDWPYIGIGTRKDSNLIPREEHPPMSQAYTTRPIPGDSPCPTLTPDTQSEVSLVGAIKLKKPECNFQNHCGIMFLIYSTYGFKMVLFWKLVDALDLFFK